MQRIITAILGTLVMLAALAPRAIAQAPTLSMDDFSYGSELTPAETEFRRFTLTPAMIKDIKRRDLGDVRVFDENNELMPVLVRKIKGNIKTSRQALTLSPFVVTGKTTAYILDRTKDHKQWLKSLHLQWQKNKAPTMLSVRVEHSADKIKWKTLKNSEMVNNFKFGNTVLKQNVIDINSTTQRYIKLVFLQQKRVPPVLKSVNATITSTKPADPSWVSLGKLTPQAGKPDSYQFSVSEGVSPSWLRMTFSKLNTVLSGSLYTVSSINGQQQRKLVANNLNAYKVTLNNKVVTSKAINLSHWQSSDWIFAANAGSNIQTQDLPNVMVAYPSYEVIFAADGDEPYTAVWGNHMAGASASKNIVQRIRADKLTRKNIAVVTHGHVLSTTSLAELIESRRFPWLTILIVLALLAIVVVAAKIAYQRYQSAED